MCVSLAVSFCYVSLSVLSLLCVSCCVFLLCVSVCVVSVVVWKEEREEDTEEAG